jgi:hypothetical protein
MFECVRTFWANGKGAWLALDFEAWDRDHKIITEIGWRSLRCGDGNMDVDEYGHIIIKEHRYYNSTYVPQYREVERSSAIFNLKLTKDNLEIQLRSK